MAVKFDGDGKVLPTTVPTYTPPTPRRPTGTVLSGVASASAATAGGSAADAYATAAAEAAAKELEDKKKSSARLLKQSAMLDGQIKALRYSLSSGFKAALNQRLANIQLSEAQGIAALKEGYGERVRSLDEAKVNNTKAAATASQENIVNRNRERAQLLAEAALQGAGESDVLRSQQIAIRSWDANQSDVNRGFFDTLSSINAGLRDLNVDTKTGFRNVTSAASGDRDAVWTNFYNQSSEGLIQLGNLYGQRAETLGMANELVPDKKVVGSQDAAASSSDDAFMKAAKESAKAYKDPGEPAWLKTWKGQGDFKSDMAARTFAQANQPVARVARPEGATLRKWGG